MRLQFKSKSWGLCLYVANDDAYSFAIKITPRKLTFWCSYWICVTDYRQGYEIKGKFCVCWNLTTRKWKLFWRNFLIEKCASWVSIRKFNKKFKNFLEAKLINSKFVKIIGFRSHPFITKNLTIRWRYLQQFLIKVWNISDAHTTNLI